MSNTITITYGFEPGVACAGQLGYALSAVASASSFSVNEIFRFRVLPLEPGQTIADAYFDGVCSPADLEDFPAGAPAADSDPAWFRLANVTLVVRSRSELEELHALLNEEIQALLTAITRTSALSALTVTVLSG
jgi:hypothetical protein